MERSWEDCRPGEALELEGAPGLEASWHVWGEDEQAALLAARGSGRPLLLRGRPGVGKTQLGRAAAQWLGAALVYQAVDGATGTADLLWRLDLVARLGEAQTARGPEDRAGLALERFLEPMALWWGFHWEGAAALGRGGPARWFEERSGAGVVVLIDEIDKAEPAVPNALLDALGHGRFSAPGREVCRQGPPPLVIFTTNEERSLPEAFLRRCLSLELALPEDKAALRDWLWARGRRHFPQISEAVQGEVAGLLHEDRQRCQELGLGEPGLAEHLDLLRALQALAPGKEEQQRRMIGVLRRFHFQKHPRSGP